MIQVDICQNDVETIKYARNHHPHPRVQQRMDVLCIIKNENQFLGDLFNEEYRNDH